VNAFQGLSVALSADGNTAILGGIRDTDSNGDRTRPLPRSRQCTPLESLMSR